MERLPREVRPDTSLESPEEHPWHSLTIAADDRTLDVHYVRGMWQALHSILVDAGPDEIRLTILLGLSHEHVERAARGEEIGYVLMGFEEWTQVVLPEPVGARHIVGSVADERPGAVERKGTSSDR
jgi:hypothetical protein